MSKPIIVAHDGSEAGERAIALASELAGRSGAELIVAHVLEWSPYSFLTKEELAERHSRRKEELARAEAALVAPVVRDLIAKGYRAKGAIRYGHVAETLITIATEAGVGHIIIGRTGSGGLSTRLFGSVAGTLAQVSPVPVTIVP